MDAAKDPGARARRHEQPATPFARRVYSRGAVTSAARSARWLRAVAALAWTINAFTLIFVALLLASTGVSPRRGQPGAHVPGDRGGGGGAQVGERPALAAVARLHA